MAESNIEWTEKTWNPVVGCTKVSPGCAHCYAETMAFRLRGMALADIAAGHDPGRKRHYIEAVDDKGRWTGKLIPVPEALADPLGWRKPQMVFVNSMSDLFHEDVPDEFIDKVFAVMNATQWQLPIPADLNAKPWHTYQVLTKRADRMRRYMESRCTSNFPEPGSHPLFKVRGVLRGQGSHVMNAGACLSWPLPNVWLGVSAENQKEWDDRVWHLDETPAAVRFVSAEPLLGPINTHLDGYRDEDFDRMEEEADEGGEDKLHGEFTLAPNVDWLIVGGESGRGARPCEVRWVRDLVAQCKSADVPCFVKQMGSNCRDTVNEGDGEVSSRIHLRNPKGGDMEEWSDDLKVREFPAFTADAAP